MKGTKEEDGGSCLGSSVLTAHARACCPLGWLSAIQLAPTRSRAASVRRRPDLFQEELRDCWFPPRPESHIVFWTWTHIYSDFPNSVSFCTDAVFCNCCDQTTRRSALTWRVSRSQVRGWTILLPARSRSARTLIADVLVSFMYQGTHHVLRCRGLRFARPDFLCHSCFVSENRLNLSFTSFVHVRVRQIEGSFWKSWSGMYGTRRFRGIRNFSHVRRMGDWSSEQKLSLRLSKLFSSLFLKNLYDRRVLHRLVRILLTVCSSEWLVDHPAFTMIWNFESRHGNQFTLFSHSYLRVIGWVPVWCTSLYDLDDKRRLARGRYHESPANHHLRDWKGVERHLSTHDRRCEHCCAPFVRRPLESSDVTECCTVSSGEEAVVSDDDFSFELYLRSGVPLDPSSILCIRYETGEIPDAHDATSIKSRQLNNWISRYRLSSFRKNTSLFSESIIALRKSLSIWNVSRWLISPKIHESYQFLSLHHSSTGVRNDKMHTSRHDDRPVTFERGGRLRPSSETQSTDSWSDVALTDWTSSQIQK